MNHSNGCARTLVNLCDDVAMPNIDPTAKDWEAAIAERVGKTVKRLREELGLTAVQLSNRARESGYPISRVAITKIENNSRAGKLDVAEWLVLAYALDVPPGALLYPDLPDGLVEALPGWIQPSWVALLSLDGECKGVSDPTQYPQLTSLARMTRQRLSKVEDRKAAWAMYNVELGSARAENREPRSEVTEAALRSIAQIDRDIADLDERMAGIEGAFVEGAGSNDA